jgi:branched-chain amino acid transport system ATP-binding protein
MLKLSNLVTFYGQMMALKGVSLEVNKGEIVCLLGGKPGKSTR